MKKSLLTWQIAGFVFTSVFGVVLHFLFDWTNQSIFAAPFSAVNESVWEHMKLLFFPMLMFSGLKRQKMGRVYENFWFSNLVGISVGLILIPVLFYTLNGALGKTPDWVNIAMFFVATAVAYLTEGKLLNKNIGKGDEGTARLVLLLIAVIFVAWTFIPPRFPIFEDPITGTYGYWMN